MFNVKQSRIPFMFCICCSDSRIALIDFSVSCVLIINRNVVNKVSLYTKLVAWQSAVY